MAIEERTIYIAGDGREFDVYTDAVNHEASLERDALEELDKERRDRLAAWVLENVGHSDDPNHIEPEDVADLVMDDLPGLLETYDPDMMFFVCDIGCGAWFDTDEDGFCPRCKRSPKGVKLNFPAPPEEP